MESVDTRKVRVKVPASTANLGPGFDCLGMALQLHAWIEIGLAQETRIQLWGHHMKDVPTDKSNLIYEVAQLLFQEAGISHPELEISMYSEIPLTRGLGSSASAIIGALMGANALINHPFSTDEIFQIACKLENHPDNVSASLFGGIVVSFWDGVQAKYIRIEPEARLEVLMAIPSFQLLTEKARDVLPKNVPLQDAVFNIGHSSLLVAALCTGRLDLIQYAMKDTIHQPYRATLIPGMDKILEKAIDFGALGVSLSGAGPSMIALVERSSPHKAALESFLQETFRQENMDTQMLWLQPSAEGVRVDIVNEHDVDFISYMEGKVLI
jgi:homoserine kinase